MEKAIRSLNDGKSIPSAEKECGIERRTLSRHRSGLHWNTKDYKYLKSGFRATGLYPRNVEELLRKLPGACVDGLSRKLDETLLEWLKEQRAHPGTKEKRGRGPKVPPGVALSTEEFSGPSSEADATNFFTTSRSSKEESDGGEEQDRCGECSRPWIGYKGEDWLECCARKVWICGYCNDQDVYFICVACPGTSLHVHISWKCKRYLIKIELCKLPRWGKIKMRLRIILKNTDYKKSSRIFSTNHFRTFRVRFMESCKCLRSVFFKQHNKNFKKHVQVTPFYGISLRLLFEYASNH